jgi:hypothetical protein
MAADCSRSAGDPAFCFMLVVWGERFRRYFSDYCLPSLLAPNNIPCIANKRDSKFAIATTAEDWAELNKLDVFKLLKSHIEPVFLELPPFAAADPKMMVMSSGHMKLSNYAFARKSFGININPDSIYSDCTIRALQTSARNGVKMVLYPGVRFEFEGVVAELRQRGLLRETGTTLTVPPRMAAGIGIRNPHPFTIACHWDNDCFFEYPVYHYIGGPSNRAMIVHTISMGPIMLDYGAIDVHRDEIFEKWTLDGDYAHTNFGHFDIRSEIEYVDDSDTFMVLGFTPKNEDAIPKVPVRGGWLLRNFNKGLHLWRVYSDPIADPLKKRLYLRQVVIHEDELGKTWRQLAARDQRIIDRYVLAGVTDKDILAYAEKYRRKVRRYAEKYRRKVRRSGNKIFQDTSLERYLAKFSNVAIAKSNLAITKLNSAIMKSHFAARTSMYWMMSRYWQCRRYYWLCRQTLTFYWVYLVSQLIPGYRTRLVTQWIPGYRARLGVAFRKCLWYWVYLVSQLIPGLRVCLGAAYRKHLWRIGRLIGYWRRS